MASWAVKRAVILEVLIADSFLFLLQPFWYPEVQHNGGDDEKQDSYNKMNGKIKGKASSVKGKKEIE